MLQSPITFTSVEGLVALILSYASALDMMRQGRVSCVWMHAVQFLTEKTPLIPRLVAEQIVARGEKRPLREGGTPLIPERCVVHILDLVKPMFLAEPMFIPTTAPCTIVGNLYGDLPSLKAIFATQRWSPLGNPPSPLDECKTKTALSNQRYIFLGNYVDRGKYSLELVLLLFCMKVLWGDRIILLRGSHECASINRIYGFFDDLKRGMNIKTWKRFSDVFNGMPVAALINDQILCLPGGLSPELCCNKSEFSSSSVIKKINEIQRPTDVPDTGLLCDLLWSNYEPDIPKWSEGNGGTSFWFGTDVVMEFLQAIKWQTLVVSGQVVEFGYELHAEKQLLELFSSPDYCGEFDNKSAVANVSQDLLIGHTQYEKNKKTGCIVVMAPTKR